MRARSVVERIGVADPVPVRVDYELTPLGRTLLPIMLGIKDWAETHMDEVNAARKRYDKASRSHRG